MAKLYLGTREVTPAITVSEPITDISKANYLVKTDGTVELLKSNDNTILPLFETTTNKIYNYENNNTIEVVYCNSIKQSLYQGAFFWSSFRETFYNCKNITKVVFDNLELAGNSSFTMSFAKCEKLQSVEFSKLKSIGVEGFMEAFEECPLLQTISFQSLESVDIWSLGGLVIGSTSIKDIYFNSLKTTSFLSDDAFEMMLADTGTDVVHTLHFPSNLQSTISQLVDYPLFSGSNGYVVLAFDLPATE